MTLTTNPNARPKPIKAHRVCFINAPAIRAGDAYERATIFAPDPDSLKAALASSLAHNRPGMETRARVDRAKQLAATYDAEARHLLFRDNPDHDHDDGLAYQRQNAPR